jgi:hypothetical protein
MKTAEPEQAAAAFISEYRRLLLADRQAPSSDGN